LIAPFPAPIRGGADAAAGTCAGRRPSRDVDRGATVSGSRSGRQAGPRVPARLAVLPGWDARSAGCWRHGAPGPTRADCLAHPGQRRDVSDLSVDRGGPASRPDQGPGLRQRRTRRQRGQARPEAFTSKPAGGRGRQARGRPGGGAGRPRPLSKPPWLCCPCRSFVVQPDPAARMRRRPLDSLRSSGLGTLVTAGADDRVPAIGRRLTVQARG